MMTSTRPAGGYRGAIYNKLFKSTHSSIAWGRRDTFTVRINSWSFQFTCHSRMGKTSQKKHVSPIFSVNFKLMHCR